MAVNLDQGQFLAESVAPSFVRAEVDRLLVDERVIEAIELLLNRLRSMLGVRHLVLDRRLAVTGRFLLHDGDATFDAAFGLAVETFGLTSVRTAPWAIIATNGKPPEPALFHLACERGLGVEGWRGRVRRQLPDESNGQRGQWPFLN